MQIKTEADAERLNEIVRNRKKAPQWKTRLCGLALPVLHHAKETIAGPWAPAVGGLTGRATGTVAGAAGYLGGEVASRRILEVIDPDFLHDAESAMIRDARDRIERSIRNKVAGRCNAKGSLSCSLCVFGL